MRSKCRICASKVGTAGKRCGGELGEKVKILPHGHGLSCFALPDETCTFFHMYHNTLWHGFVRSGLKWGCLKARNEN